MVLGSSTAFWGAAPWRHWSLPTALQVKQIMEEAVTCKFVHEDSSHIISFCAAVEACVLHGLWQWMAGFLCSNKIAALFMKVGKRFPPAEELSCKVQDLEQLIESMRNQIQGLQENSWKLPKLPNLSLLAIKHLWIHTALFEKVLDKIVHYLVKNKGALLVDPVGGPILASLLGICGALALEYTKMKTVDHFWTNPSADELVQRHHIHSSHLWQDSPSKRPALCIQKRHSSGSMDDRPSFSASDYVESLHQNSRATLLYGKNNVLVQLRDDMEAVPGYLSLHQTPSLLFIIYWDYAMTICLEEIVHLHCQQQVDSGGTVVLVSQDGIQRPPFRFPKGRHSLQFLSCLENGLLPHGQLDPPLWSQWRKGKVFPKLHKWSPQGSSKSTSSDKEDEEATDYMFRIIYPGMQSEFVPQDLMDVSMNILPSPWQPSPWKSSCSSCSQSGSTGGSSTNDCNHERAPLKLLCDNMKYQILSRAFYRCACTSPLLEWSPRSIYLVPAVCQKYPGTDYEEQELLHLIYYRGIQPEIHKAMGPFLLSHYEFRMMEAGRRLVTPRRLWGVLQKELDTVGLGSSGSMLDQGRQETRGDLKAHGSPTFPVQWTYNTSGICLFLNKPFILRSLYINTQL
uniref:RUN domain-containing protein n=1 Tax=Sciurus vulgaris TaxID=55149 RepID=A0A8D2DC07_SCIVU